MKLLLSLILSLSILSLNAQQYFEKNFSVGDDDVNQIGSHLVLYENDIYIAISGFCDDSSSGHCSYMLRANTLGEEIWNIRTEDFSTSEDRPFIINNDTISAILIGNEGDSIDYHRFYQWGVDGNSIRYNSFAIVDTFEVELAVSIMNYKDKYYICGHGRFRHENRVVGYISELDNNGKFLRRLYLQPPEPELLVTWPYHFLIQPVDSSLMVCIHEINSTPGPTNQQNKRSIYKINTQEWRTDSVFRSTNDRTSYSKRLLRFVFLSNGNLAYFDDAKGRNSTRSAYYFGILDNNLNIVQEFHFDEGGENNDRAYIYMDRVITDMIVLDNDDLFLCGYMDYAVDLADDSLNTWLIQTAWFARISSSGEVSWQKNITEIYPDRDRAKSQFCRSLIELENGDLMGLGSTLTYNDDGIPVQKPWLIRMNSDGCIDGTSDCEYRTLIRDTLVSGNDEVNIEFDDLLIFPTISNDIITHEASPTLNAHLYIYNSIGEIVFEEDWKGMSTSRIDVSQWKPDHYYSHLVEKGYQNVKVYQGKFIVN